MSWTELIDSTQNVQRDADGVRRGVRSYRVANYARTQILTDPTTILNDQGVGLPGYNSQWEGMRLDSYQTSASGSVYDVQALYSSDRRFVFPARLDRLEQGYRSWSGSSQNEPVQIPYAVLATTTVALPGGGMNEVSGWQFDSQRVRNTIGRITRRVVVTEGDIAELREALDNQTDKLHLINARWYHFEGGDYAEQQDGKYEVHYHWRYDPGTPVIPQPPASPSPYYPPALASRIPGVSGSWSRPPYHETVISPGEGGLATSIPIFDALLPYGVDATGWSNLPEMTL